MNYRQLISNHGICEIHESSFVYLQLISRIQKLNHEDLEDLEGRMACSSEEAK